MVDRPILFLQPFGLADPGGGARILRSLLEAAPVTCVSISSALNPPNPTALCKQFHLPYRPHCGRIETTRFHWLPSLLDPVWHSRHKQSLQRKVSDIDPAAIHLTVQAGSNVNAAMDVADSGGIPIFVSFHDHPKYNYPVGPYYNSQMRAAQRAWCEADGRFVISKEMGESLCSEFGERQFDLISDGITHVKTIPDLEPGNEVSVYFMGLYHLFYRNNFQVLIEALRSVAAARRVKFRLKVRSGWFPIQSCTDAVTVEALSFCDESTVAADINQSHFLYLPLPFDKRCRSFTDYSLSTKMITYISGGRPIIFHGPCTAAAGKLLGDHGAAMCVTDESTVSLRRALLTMLDDSGLRRSLVTSASQLAKTRFDLAPIRRRFWNRLLAFETKPQVAPPIAGVAAPATSIRI